MRCQALIEAWCRVAPSDRRLLQSPLQRRSPRTSPRCDVAVVSRVLLVRCLSYTHVSVAVHAAAALALAFTLARQLVRRAPAGSSPCSTYLHSAMSSLRARATTPTLRARLPWSAKRRAYQRLSSLSGCQRSQPQASSTIIRRSTLLPALLIPCSRLSAPDWYGVGVRPTSAPTCRRLLNFRQGISKAGSKVLRRMM